MKHVLAFDIGGSKMVAGIVDETGLVLTRTKHQWEKLDQKSVLDTILSIGRDVLAGFGQDVSGIGASIPGLCDPVSGLWVESCFSGLNNVPIGSILKEAFGLPAAVENDVNACALAEKKFGCCQDVSDFIWLTVSNGCGGALFLNNTLYRGVSGNAGELGHIVVEEDSRFICGCGNHGCLEIEAAGPGIARHYKLIHPDSTLSAAEIAEMARNGDADAIKVFSDEGRYLGRAIATAVNTVNPQKVVIGGGVSASFDLFAKTLRETVNSRIYRFANPNLVIETTRLGYDAPLIGAAVLALDGRFFTGETE